MAQALSIHHTSTLTRKFEELPLYREILAGERFFGGMIDGEFTVEYDANTNWQFAGLSIELDNLRHGNHAKGRTVELDPDHDEALMLVIYNALQRDYSDNIDAWVMEQIDELQAA